MAEALFPGWAPCQHCHSFRSPRRLAASRCRNRRVCRLRVRGLVPDSLASLALRFLQDSLFPEVPCG